MAGILLAEGAFDTARGDRGFVGMPGWVELAIGVALFVGFIALAPVERIVDPCTGRPRGPGGRVFVLRSLGFAALIGVLLAGPGLLTR